MQKLIKILFKDKVTYLAVFITVVICYLSLKNLNNFQLSSVSHIDKLFHAIAYFFLCIFWLLSFSEFKASNSLKYTIAVCCIIFGIIIEILQSTLTTYRTASLLDLLANTVGVVVAIIVFKSIYKKIVAI